MVIAITGAQRLALYQRAIDQLRGFDDLLEAEKAGDLEAASREGRRMLDALRLAHEVIGWGEHATPHGIELGKMCPGDLKEILRRVYDDATAQYEHERPEQEEFRLTWERTRLVRDACEELLSALAGTEPKKSGGENSR